MNDESNLNINWNIGQPKVAASKSAQKQAQVEMTTAQKLASFGAPQEQRALATARRQGNDVAQDQGLQDLVDMNPLEYFDTYGAEAERARYNFGDAIREVDNIKNRQRSTGDMLKDSAIDAGNIAASMIGGAAALGALGSDAIFGTQVSPRISEGVDWFRGRTQEMQSDAFQDRREQHGIEAELSRQDRQARYEERVAEQGEDAWGPWLQKQGEAVRDTVANYADDGMMMTSLAAESLGSLAPQALAARVLGRAAAKQAIMKSGRSAEQAAALLKTAPGQEILRRSTERAALGSVAASETGAAVQQAQSELMSMDLAELQELPEFQDHMASGMNEDEARRQLAVDAGTIAAPAALPLALGAGAIASKVVANPLAKGQSAGGIVGNLGREMTEEALQEGNSTVAANLGIREQGIDRALDEGVAEAATQGAMGGAMSVATLQSPSAALDLTKTTAKLTGSAVVAGARKAGDAAKARNDRKADERSATGTAERASAADTLAEANDRMRAQQQARAEERQAQAEARAAERASAAAARGEAVAEPTEEEIQTQEQEETQEALRAEVAEDIDRALVLSQSELEENVAQSPRLAQMAQDNPGQPLPRTALLEDLGEDVANTELDEGDRLGTALEYLRQFERLKSMASSRNVDFVESLAEDDAMRTSMSDMRAKLPVYEASPQAAEARRLVGTLTREQVQAVFPVESMTDPNMSEDERFSSIEAIRTVHAYNPTAVDADTYSRFMSQLGSDEVSKRLKSKLQAEMDLIRAMDESVAEKAKIEEDLKEAGYKTSDIVRNEIHKAGNSDNGMASLNDHHAKISEAARSGRTDEATAMLKDLADFARSQANKVGALNASAESGLGRSKKFPYKAHGPYGQFVRNEANKGVFFDSAYPKSAGLAREIRVDAMDAANMVRSLATAYDLQADVIEVPKLSDKIMQTVASPSSIAGAAQNPANTQPLIPPKKGDVAADPVVDQAIDNLEDLAVRRKTRKTVKEAAAPVTSQTEEILDEADTTVSEEDAAASVEETATESEVGTTEAPAERAGRWLEGLKDRLVKGREGKDNSFLAAFKPAKNTTTRFHDSDVRPSQAMQESIEQTTADPVAQEAVKTVLSDDLSDFENWLNDEAQAHVSEKDIDLDPGRNQDYSEGMSLAFLSQNEDGPPTMDPKVVEAVFMSGMEWLTANARDPRPMDDEDINELFGKDRGAKVTDAERALADSGTMSYLANKQIADGAQRLLGISSDNDAALRTTQGQFRSLAANFMAYAGPKGNGLMSVEKMDVPGTDGKPKTYMAVRGNMENFKDHHVKLSDQRELFSRHFLGNAEGDFLVGEPATTIRDTQLGNNFAKISRKEREVIDRLQKMPSFINEPMIAIMELLGADTFKKIMGYKELSEADRKKYNVETLKKIDGQNQTISHDTAGTMDYIQRTRELAGKDGDARQIPIFFRFAISSVGRLQQIGRTTPQGSKIMREMVAATHSTLDLASNEEHVRAFWLGVAQSIGVKIENTSYADALGQAQDKLDSPKLAPALQMLEDHFSGKAALDADAFAKAIGTTDAKTLHTLVTVARYRTASEGQLANFETALAIEADGKTDGPINAMVHFLAGEFTAKQIMTFAKGGLFFADRPISLSKYIALEKDRMGSAGGQDLYQLASDTFAENLQTALDNAEPQTLRKQNAVLTVLNAFLKDFDLLRDSNGNVDSFSIGRNITKNPLTVFIYGSGIKGIAGKVTSAVQESIADMLTDVLQNGGTFVNHEKFKNDPQLAQAMADLMFGGNRHAFRQWITDAKDARVQGRKYDQLQTAILEHFVEPMVDAIDESTGGLSEEMRKLQSSAKIQQLIFKDVFQRKLQAAVKAKNDGNVKGKLMLTENEVNDVFLDAMKIAPIYTTDAQSFHIAAAQPETADRTYGPLSSSFDNQFETRPTLPTPAEASVKVSPYLTIGMGDGRMILNIYANGDVALDTSLPVFDGVELALESMHGASLQINEQTLDGWLEGNPYEAVADGFELMVRNMSEKAFGELSRETRKEIYDALNPRGKTEVITRANVAALRTRALYLRDMAQGVEARKAAFKEVGIVSDHMAGSEAPAFRKGDSIAVVEGEIAPDPTDHESIAQLLEAKRVEKLKEIQEKAGAKLAEPRAAKYAQPEQAGMVERINEFTTEVENHPGVRTAPADRAALLMTREAGASKEQIGTFKSLQELAPLGEETTFYFGTSEDLTALRNEIAGQEDQAIELGETLFKDGKQHLFIANASPETMLHEMLHGYTQRILDNHFQDPDASPEQVKYAVARLEEQLTDFMALQDLASYPEDRVSALLHARRNIGALKGDRAAQLGELIAYSLSNQDLIELGRKTKTYRPLMSVVMKALAAVKELLGIKGRPGDSFFSNMRFNTQVMLTTERKEAQSEEIEDAEADRIMRQTFGQDDRLDRIEQAYLGRLRKMVRDRTSAPDQAAIGRAIADMRRDYVKAEQAGFQMNRREADAFGAVHATLKAGMRLSAGVRSQLVDHMALAMRELTPDLLLSSQGITAPTEAQAARAESMISYLNNVRKNPNQTEIFLALAQTNTELRNALEAIKVPGADPVRDVRNVSDLLGWSADMAMRFVIRGSTARRNASPSLRADLDRLSGQLEKIQEERKVFSAMKQANGWVDWANKASGEFIKEKSRKAADYLNDKSDETQNRAKKFMLDAGTMAMNMGSSEGAQANGDFATRFFNEVEGWDTMRQLVSDLRGMTQENTPLLRMLNPVRAQIDALRQAYRDGTPSDLQELFKTRQPTEEDWTRMHKGIAQADLLALGHEASMALLKDSNAAGRMIAEQEEILQGVSSKLAPLYKVKAKALARFMVTGEITSANLLANADAIAYLLNEQGMDKTEILKAVTSKTIEAIDKLTSLYAFEMLDPAVKDTLAEMAEAEPEAMEAVTGFINTARKLEKSRISKTGNDSNTRFNGWKGYAPATAQEGKSMIVADDLEQRDLERRGYVRVKDYPASPLERYAPKRGYYMSTVAGRPTFNQGVAQTVHDTWQGVSARNGRTNDGRTSGAVTGEMAGDMAFRAKRMGSKRLNNLPAGAHPIPRFNSDGEIISYELPVEAEQQAMVPKDENLARMLGVWMGRILEENVADKTNSQFVETMHGIYEDARKKGDLAGFIDVSRSKDPVIADAWNSLGDKVKGEILDTFGPEGFMVRKEMVEDAIGSRMPSVTDAWTGTTRWSPEAQKRFTGFLNDFVGDDAYKWLKRAESGVQEAVGYAKTTIIVRSVKVAFDNVLSNMLHLQTLGVGPIKFLTEGRRKLIEINRYLSNREKRRKLDIELARNLEDTAARKRIENQIALLERENDQLSIKPLIDAGEFSSISENLTEQDMAMRDGKLIQYINRAADKLPSFAKDLGKNVLITKDTELFKIMNRMVQYGDFVAKAVLYDHEMAKEDADERQVLDRIFEEFVAYNRGAGRTRSYLEGMGLAWFWSYKLRIMKVAHRTMLERPLSALFMMGGVGSALDVQSVYDGSVIGAGLDGRLPFAVGPEMGLQTANLHPFWGALD